MAFSNHRTFTLNATTGTSDPDSLNSAPITGAWKNAQSAAQYGGFASMSPGFGVDGTGTNIRLFYQGNYIGIVHQGWGTVGTNFGTGFIGGDSDGWGAGLTPAVLNDPSFGIGLSMLCFTTGGPNQPFVSEYLRLTNFGFAIPSNAQVIGLVYEYETQVLAGLGFTAGAHLLTAYYLTPPYWIGVQSGTGLAKMIT